MGNLHIIMYHYTRDLKNSRYPNIKGLDYAMFHEQIMFLKRKFNIVTMEQVLEAVWSGGGYFPENAVLLTFDDGYIDHYTYALPILEEAGVQGSFFIPGKTFSTHQLLDVNKIHYILASADIQNLVLDVKERLDFYRGTEYDYASNEELFDQYAVAGRFDDRETVFVKRILQKALPEELRNRISSDLFEKYVGISEEKLAMELYMNEDQIKTLKRHGMFIGVHGYDHYWLGDLPEAQMQSDITKALEVMDEFIDSKCWVMNYPYGNYSKEVLDFIDRKSAKVGVTTKVSIAHLKKDNRLELPRLNCNDFPPKSDNYRLCFS